MSEDNPGRHLILSHILALLVTLVLAVASLSVIFKDIESLYTLTQIVVSTAVLQALLLFLTDDILKSETSGSIIKIFATHSRTKLALLATLVLLVFSVSSGTQAVLLSKLGDATPQIEGLFRLSILILTIISAAYAIALSLQRFVSSYHKEMTDLIDSYNGGMVGRYNLLLDYAQIVKDVNKIGRSEVLKDLAGISHSIAQKERLALTQDILVRLLRYTSKEYLDGHMVNVQVSSGDKDISRLFRAICDVLMQRRDRASYYTVSFVDFWSPLVLDDARAFFGNNQACAQRGVEVKRLLVLKDSDFISPRRDLLKEILRWHVEQYLVAERTKTKPIRICVIFERDYFDNPYSKTDLRNYVVCTVHNSRKTHDRSIIVVDMEYVPMSDRDNVYFQSLASFHFLNDQRCEAFESDFTRLWSIPDSIDIKFLLDEIDKDGADATRLTDRLFDKISCLHNPPAKKNVRITQSEATGDEHSEEENGCLAETTIKNTAEQEHVGGDADTKSVNRGG